MLVFNNTKSSLTFKIYNKQINKKNTPIEKKRRKKMCFSSWFTYVCNISAS